MMADERKPPEPRMDTHKGCVPRRYRKRQVVVVTAQQFRPDVKPWPEGVYESGPRHWRIKTLEGVYNVRHGDWIITGIKGERYPCKPDIFEATYEAVDD